ncbi:uncharacterized protein N7458_009659 [Penicillium daleae]|uniref:Uncharacterized protein n=1 Tax=Penicillium daleae TaxID=63821 RepID=A0AAD6BXE8_9EURO|nr:uncharacterized protein N7458_009659 [Penicillium daleae]KAJ5438661.1 hypothetical protein N7458_009659 [Penicillium daleae]
MPPSPGLKCSDVQGAGAGASAKQARRKRDADANAEQSSMLLSRILTLSLFLSLSPRIAQSEAIDGALIITRSDSMVAASSEHRCLSSARTQMTSAKHGVKL